jgi:hypothetical protein
MTDRKREFGGALRFLASGGWADQDPDAIADLLGEARELASVVAADDSCSSEARTTARNFLARLEGDTLA